MKCFDSAVPAIFLSYAPTFFVLRTTVCFASVVKIAALKYTKF